MALNLQWFIDRAARRIGDPSKTRITQDELLEHVNLSIGDVCSKYDIFEVEDDFDLPAGKELSYPLESTRLSGIEVSATPDNQDSFVTLREGYQDEYRRATQGGTYPVGDVPEFYLAAQGSIRIWPKPSVAIINGGIIRYFGVPEYITDANTTMPLPEFLRSYILERVVIYALEADDRDAQARGREVKWLERENEIRDLIEDRSVDRQTALRPESQRRGNRGHA